MACTPGRKRLGHRNTPLDGLGIAGLLAALTRHRERRSSHDKLRHQDGTQDRKSLEDIRQRCACTGQRHPHNPAGNVRTTWAQRRRQVHAHATIATLQQPDSGRSSSATSTFSRRNTGCGRHSEISPQEFGVYPNVTAERLLEHFAVLKGVADRKQRKEVVSALLHQTNLYDVRKKKLGGYSGGMRAEIRRCSRVTLESKTDHRRRANGWP